MKTLLITLLVMLTGCDNPLLDNGGPYDDLLKKYPQKNEEKVKAIKPERLAIYSQHHRSTLNFNGTSKVQLTNSAVFISVYNPIEIPEQSISGCACSWFGKDSWDAVLILGEDRTHISIHLSEETKDWCYENNKPIILGKYERDWKYKGKSLPSFASYQQPERAEFDNQFRRSCMGY
jgi:hypothetical protein